MFYTKLVRPQLFKYDPETIHDRVLLALGRFGRIPILPRIVHKMCTVRDPRKRLEQKCLGLTFPNPVGLAAGMDKGGEALRGFEMLGFGFLEMGGVTSMGQDGNPKPRIFRLPEDEALINRMGFNNPGAETVAFRLSQVQRPNVPVGINIGKSKVVPVEEIEKVVADYCFTFGRLYHYADFFVVNVSSPNTPGLRGLQGKEFLTALLKGIQRQNLKIPRKPHTGMKPVLLKIAPDLTEQEIDDILAVVKELGIDGIVAVNTTTNREGLNTTGDVIKEVGGLSGKPLQGRAFDVVAYIHQKFPSLPIIAVGGIFSGEDAYAMFRAGASLVQIYTSLVFEGPMLVRRINRKLLQLMQRDDFFFELNGVNSD